MGRFDQFTKPEEPSSFSRKTILWILTVAGFVIIVVIYFILRGSGGSRPELTRIVSTVEATHTVTTTLEVTQTPFLTPTATASSTATETAMPIVTAINTQTPTFTPTLLPTSTPTLTHTPTPEIVTPVAECIQNAAFYAGPGLQYSQIGVFVATGEELPVEARSEDGKWIIVEKEGKRGWVTTSFFELNASINSLPTSGEIITIPNPTGNVGSPSSSSLSSSIAYWNELSKEHTGDGRWKVTLSVRVPAGEGYVFDMRELNVNVEFDKAVENNFVLYNVTISGMSCDGSLVGNLVVTRNGQALEVRNEFTGETGSVFIKAASDC